MDMIFSTFEGLIKFDKIESFILGYLSPSIFNKTIISSEFEQKKYALFI